MVGAYSHVSIYIQSQICPEVFFVIMRPRFPPTTTLLSNINQSRKSFQIPIKMYLGQAGFLFAFMRHRFLQKPSIPLTVTVTSAQIFPSRVMFVCRVFNMCH